MQNIYIVRCLKVLIIGSGIWLTACNTVPTIETITTTKPSKTLLEEIEAKGGSSHILLTNTSIDLPRSSAGFAVTTSIVNNSKIRDYLREILARIVASTPASLALETEVDVFVVSNKGKTAIYATPADDILMGYDAVASMGSQDELAFILAHELAHIILHHKDKDRTLVSWDAVAKLTEKLAGVFYDIKASAITSNPNDYTLEEQEQLYQALSRMRMATSSIRLLVMGVLRGAWSRDQERDADRLAFDLMVKAGFNGSAASSALDRMSNDKELSEHLKKHITDIEDAAKVLTALDSKQNAIAAWGKGVGVDLLCKAVRKAINFLDDTHEATEKRKAALFQEYVDHLGLARNPRVIIDKKGYQDTLAQMGFTKLASKLDTAWEVLYELEEKKIKPGQGNDYMPIISGSGGKQGFTRYVFYKLRLNDKKKGTAMKNLSIARQHQSSDLPTNFAYAMELVHSGKMEEALSVVSRLEHAFSEPPGSLKDLRGKLYAEAEMWELASKEWDQCDTQSPHYVISRCDFVRSEYTYAISTANKPQKSSQEPTKMPNESALPSFGDKLRNLLEKPFGQPSP